MKKKIKKLLIEALEFYANPDNCREGVPGEPAVSSGYYFWAEDKE